MINEESQALVGSSPATAEWLGAIWFAPDADLRNDVGVVVDAAGRLAGAFSVDAAPPYTRIEGIGCVALDHHGRGLGAALVAEMEHRAARFVALAPPGSRVVMQAGTLADEPRVAGLMVQNGYVPGLMTYRAELEFGAPPAVTAPPPGIELRTVAPGQERAVYDCLTEAFVDDWHDGGWPTWEVWHHRYIANRPFDPRTVVGGLGRRLGGGGAGGKGRVG